MLGLFSGDKLTPRYENIYTLLANCIALGGGPQGDPTDKICWEELHVMLKRCFAGFLLEYSQGEYVFCSYADFYAKCPVVFKQILFVLKSKRS